MSKVTVNIEQAPIEPDPLQEKRSDSMHLAWNITYGILLLILMCIAGFLGYRYATLLREQEAFQKELEVVHTIPTRIPTPTPTPIFLQEGKGTYTISHPRGSGPTITQVTFDPLNAQKDSMLTISTSIKSAKPISSVHGKITTDTKAIDLVFTKIDVQNEIETWATQFPLTDTVWYSYIVTITASDTNGDTTITVAPRS